jgi:uncharacterized membrane-anchored protein
MTRIGQSLTRIVLSAAIFGLLAGVPQSQAWAQAAPAADGATAGATEDIEAKQLEARRQEARDAYAAALAAATKGPGKITLVDQATLDLPADSIFVPLQPATRLMRAYGNTVDSQFAGIIMPASDQEGWFITVDFNRDGYVKDDDAKNWNADDLLQSIKDGTAASNEDRVARGFPAMEIAGWIEKPAYDSSTHRLVWSIKAHDAGATDSDDSNVNYNTYALGRDGYFSLDLITSQGQIEKDKVHAKTTLAALNYNDGKRYEQYIAGTDPLAAYGIAALIGGVAAKKLGLFALAGVFLVKFAKIIGIAAIAAFAGIARLFSRSKA